MFVKICGITCVADARMVAQAGANAIGLNFYAGSPRCVSIDAAREIVASLPPYLDPVGVFVNTTTADVRQIASAVGLRTVQLHGDHSPVQVVELREFAVVPAFGLADEQAVAGVTDYVSACDRLGRRPAAVLVDAFVPGKLGGTGQTAPWPLSRSVVDRCGVPVMLAGGLTPKNVVDAIRAVRPWGVDVASGVEVSPGRKETYKVSRFVTAARSGC
jgi:phosphoribosylanthranilate isomerase